MLESTNNTISYEIINGLRYPFAVRFFRPADIVCYLYIQSSRASVRLTPGYDYTVESVATDEQGDPIEDYSNGGDVVLLTTEGSRFAAGLEGYLGDRLTIIRQVPLTQTLDLPQNGKLPSDGIENQLDHTMMVCQQLSEELSRAVVSPPGGSAGVTLRDLEAYVSAAAGHAANAAVYASGGTIGTALVSGAMDYRDTAAIHMTTASRYSSNASAAANRASAAVINAQMYASAANGYMNNAQVYASGGNIGGMAVSGALDYRNDAANYYNSMPSRFVEFGLTTDGNSSGGYMVLPGAGQPIHDLSEFLVSGEGGVSCVIPWENGHIYSGSFPVVGSGWDATSKVYLMPGSGAIGGRMCTFELHLNHGAAPTNIDFLNVTSGTSRVWWWNTDRQDFNKDNPAPIPVAGTVQAITIRGEVPARTSGTWGDIADPAVQDIYYLANTAYTRSLFDGSK